MKLDEPDHRSLALWAADCAGRVLPCFEEERPEDDRPRRAVEGGMAWARGEIRVGEARVAAIAAHAAVREADPAGAPPPGPWPPPWHEPAGRPVAAGERGRQYRRLPEHLRPVVFPGR